MKSLSPRILRKVKQAADESDRTSNRHYTYFRYIPTAVQGKVGWESTLDQTKLNLYHHNSCWNQL